MIVEELVARLGFKATGLGDLKKFEAGLKGAKAAVSSFGTTLNRAFGTGLLRDVAGFLPKIGNALKSGASSAAIFAASLGRIALIGGGVAAGIGLAVAAVLALGKALVSAGGAAAQLRRQLQIKAAYGRTTAGNVDAMAKGFENILPGIGGDESRKAWEDLAEKSSEAIRDPNSDAAKQFKAAGVPLLDRRGNQRDTTAVQDDVLKSYLDRQKRVVDLRAAAEADKGSRRKLAKANAEEVAFRRDQDKDAYPGITKDLRAALKGMTYDEFARRREGANARDPNLTKQQEDQAARVSASYQELLETLSGLAQPFKQLGMTITESLLGPLNSLGSTLLDWGKRLGIINRTQAEVDRDREEGSARARLSRDAQNTASKALDKVGGESGVASFLSALFRAGLITPAERSQFNDKKSRYDQERARGPDNAAGISAAAQALAAAIEDLRSRASPETASRSLSRDAAVKAELTGSAEVRGSAEITGKFTLDASGFASAIATKVDAKLAGALNAAGGRGSAKAMNTATAGAGSP